MLKTTCSTLLALIAILLCLLLAAPALATECEIIDSEFTVLDNSLNSPSSAVLDASGSPVQSDPSSQSYLVDAEYSVADVTTSSPSSAVLDVSGSPVQSDPSSQSYLVDTEYSVVDVTAVSPTSDVLDASDAPVQSDPSSQSYIIDTEYSVADTTTSSPGSAVLDASGSPVQSDPSSKSYLIDTEYSVVDVTAVSPTSDVLDASDAPVQSDPSSQSYLIDTEYSVADTTTSSPGSAVLDASGSPVQSDPSSQSYLIDTEFTVLDESELEPWSGISTLHLTITSPDAPHTTIHTSTITVTGTASDPSGIASVTVNGALASGAADWSTWNAEVALAVGENAITVIAKDLESNKKVVTLQVFYHVNEDVYPLFSNSNQVEVGGTFYRWYKTIPYSTISIDSNYLEYSQPDENGVFNVSVNTSKHGITSLGAIDVLTSSASITKNGQTMHIDPSSLSFALNVLPRNYSTSWYLGSTIGGGGGVIKYVEGERNIDFAMTTGNQDSILLMNRDKADKVTGGATAALFEAKAGVVEVGLPSIDVHVSMQMMYGSQVNVDYENANDAQKLEGALYILTSTISSANPLTYETINVVSNILTGDLTTDYYESGVGISGGSSANLVEVEFGPCGEPGCKEKKATIGNLDIGAGGERGVSLKRRTYPATDFHEYLAQYVYSAEQGLHGSVLGNDIVNWGPSDYIDDTVILGQDTNKVLYGKAKIKDSEKQVESDYVTRELTYDYGPIADDRIINPFETDNIPVSSAVRTFMDAIKDYFSQGNITVVETRGQRLAIELPLSLTIAGVKVSINPGVRMGDANNYLTDKKVMYNKEPYTLEKYAYDTNVQGSAEELIHIVGSLLEPVGAAMEDVMKTIEAIAEKGKEIVFSTGKIIFDASTHFFTVDDSYSSTYSTTSSRFTQSDDQSPEIIISTYTPDEPAPQTMATFGAMGISSSYVTSLSGGDFVIGNITDLQPYNISFTPAAQLTLNYTEEDVAGIDESNISIYRWDDANNSWMPFFSIVNTTENIVTTNITRFGTYAIGYDITNPVIEWNASDLYQGNITVEAIIADTGSGINISSIRLYADGDEQNFTYNIFSGLLKSTINASVSDHAVRIYAEDTSGNGNVTEKVVTSIEPAAVTCLQINRTGNDTIELSWTGESGTYSIQNYLIYRNVELVINTTQTNFTTESTGSATYTVYPVDVNGNIGTGKAMTYRLSQLIPEFTYDWENTLYPTTGCPIIFDATGSHLINGTIETNITTYTWIFDDDVNNTESGEIISYTFTNAGLHKITLQIEDDIQNNATITEILNITASTKGDLDLDGNVTSTDVQIALDIAFSGEYMSEADIDANGYVNVLDARMIMLAAAGEISL